MSPTSRHLRSLLLAGASCVVFGFSQARATTMDYTTLEQMFGEPVTTSATGQPQRASDVPADMVIVTQDDIRRSGADNIPDILRYITGIDVETDGVTSSNVGIRGFNQPENPHLLVLIDGREVFLDDYGYVDWGALPVVLSSIRQIEVVKGPNSALFGFNAVSGVVNIITYDPLLDNANTITASGGTQDMRSASGVVTYHPTTNSGVRFTGAITKLNEYQPFANLVPGAVTGSPEIVSNWHGFLTADAKFRVTEKLILGLGITMEDGQELASTPTGSLFDPVGRTNSIRLTADADTGIGAIAANIYHNEFAFSAAGTIAWVNSKYVAQLSDTKKLNPTNVVRIGLEFRRNQVTGNTFFDGTIGYNNLAASAMWNWQILDSLSFTNAVRIDDLSLFRSSTYPPIIPLTNADYNSRKLIGYSYNSGLVYKFTADDTFRLTTARGLQVPSLIDFGALAVFGPTSEYGTPTVTPAVLTDYEFNYGRHIAAINGSAGAAIYYERLDNLVSGPFGTPTSESGNFGSEHQVGAEFTIKGQTGGGIRYNLGYSISRGTDHTILAPAGKVPLEAVNYAESTPQHVVTGGLGTNIGPWEMDAALRYQTSTDQLAPGTAPGAPNQLEEIPAYTSVSARVGYHVFTHATLAITVQQALSPSLIETTDQKIGRRIIGSLTATF